MRQVSLFLGSYPRQASVVIQALIDLKSQISPDVFFNVYTDQECIQIDGVSFHRCESLHQSSFLLKQALLEGKTDAIYAVCPFGRLPSLEIRQVIFPILTQPIHQSLVFSPSNHDFNFQSLQYLRSFYKERFDREADSISILATTHQLMNLQTGQQNQWYEKLALLNLPKTVNFYGNQTLSALKEHIADLFLTDTDCLNMLGECIDFCQQEEDSVKGSKIHTYPTCWVYEAMPTWTCYQHKILIKKMLNDLEAGICLKSNQRWIKTL